MRCVCLLVEHRPMRVEILAEPLPTGWLVVVVLRDWGGRTLDASPEVVVSQCPRGHFCSPTALTGPAYGHVGLVSQCPRGHFCFPTRGRVDVFWRADVCHSALAGIFVFRRNRQGQDHWHIRVSQCPRGHFCFPTYDGMRPGENSEAEGHSALAGIFVFRPTVD